MSKQKSPREAWTVHAPDRDITKHFDTRGDAEDRLEKAADLGMDADLYPPGELPGDDDADDEPLEAEVVDSQLEPDAEPEYNLDNRSVSEDPLEWVPGSFVDDIDGTQAINRKGFEVLAHFYDVDVAVDLQVAPEDTEFQFCRVKATATTPDGRTCEAYGSAHVDRGDDAEILLEMADTRARKRALSIATGVGAVAVEELRNEVEQ